MSCKYCGRDHLSEDHSIIPFFKEREEELLRGCNYCGHSWNSHMENSQGIYQCQEDGCECKERRRS